MTDHRLPPVLFDTLKACAEEPLTTGKIATRFEVTLAGARWRLKELRARGLIVSTRCLRQPVELSEAGKAAVAAGPGRPPVDLPAPPDTPPAFVGVSTNGLALLKLLYERALAGDSPTIEAAAAHLGVSKSDVNTLSHTLRVAGLATRAATVPPCYGGRQRLTGLGVAVVLGRVRVVSQQSAAAARRAERGEKIRRTENESRPSPAPKPRVPLTHQALALVKLIHDLNKAGLEVTVAALAEQADRSANTVRTVLDTLRARKVLAPASFDLTPLGLDVVEGRAAITRPFQVGVAPRLPRAPMAKPSLATCQAPPPAPKPSAAPKTSALPPPELPNLPAPIATLRGIKHPPLPQAHPAPPGMREATWVAITTVRSPMASGWS